MEPSEAMAARIRREAQKLDRFHDHIMACRVTVEAPHQHHHQGSLYQVKVDLTVPGTELVASHQQHDRHEHEDAYVAVRDAFDAVQRQLEDYARRRRGKVKRHTVPPHGMIKQLVPMADYGIIATADGREIYFHRNSVVDTTFDQLQVGDEVRFIEQQGESGPQASTVHLCGKHHIVG
jgi:ribosomal subunit interface protein